jgi:uncharacterized protein (TIGR02594 family)
MSQAPSNLDKIPWLAAGSRELGVARFGAVGAHGQYLASYDSEHHIRNNPRILEYLKETTSHSKSESTSWCSAFVNWCMVRAGIPGTRSAMARSWLHWHEGVKLDAPAVGAVVVFPRPPDPSQGHVAMIWRVGDHGALDVLGGNQGAHAANAARHVAAESSHVSIAHRKAGTALAFLWPKHFARPSSGAAPAHSGHAGGTMLILRGRAGHYAGRDWPQGAMHEGPALEFAKRRGFKGRVLDVAGETGTHTRQTQMALAEFRRDASITALYGFSAGGYNIKHILDQLTREEKARLQLVIVLGAPKAPESLFRGPWELIYRTDPPGGHMDGPVALLTSTV